MVVIVESCSGFGYKSTYTRVSIPKAILQCSRLLQFVPRCRLIKMTPDDLSIIQINPKIKMQVAVVGEKLVKLRCNVHGALRQKTESRAFVDLKSL